MNRVIMDDKIITTTTVVRESNRYVDYNDILESVTIEADDCDSDAPWETCDGYEHQVSECNYPDYEGIKESHGYGHSSFNNAFMITIDDDTVVNKWGCKGYHGCSKQVGAEMIAQEKRNTIDKLVDWYTNGWTYYQVCGDYQGYTDSLCGIDCPDYAEDLRYEIADEIASQMENDDYIIKGRPKRKEYTNRDRFQDQLNRNKRLGVMEVR